MSSTAPQAARKAERSSQDVSPALQDALALSKSCWTRCAAPSNAFSLGTSGSIRRPMLALTLVLFSAPGSCRRRSKILTTSSQRTRASWRSSLIQSRRALAIFSSAAWRPSRKATPVTQIHSSEISWSTRMYCPAFSRRSRAELMRSASPMSPSSPRSAHETSSHSGSVSSYDGPWHSRYAALPCPRTAFIKPLSVYPGGFFDCKCPRWHLAPKEQPVLLFERSCEYSHVAPYLHLP
mmetsp:Transcript_22049/g.42329  ORF Transcript_22049/g.42329 Transcript_22049/m.42329 type:complete len:237 (-) Transcript_22049:373-1083(-)